MAAKNALVVPADPSLPAHVVDLAEGGGELPTLQRLVGGYVEAQAHPEGDLWCNESGRLDGLPVNVRASHWMLTASSAARAQAVDGITRVGEGFVLYGDVVVTGPPDGDGETTPVRAELVEHFTRTAVSADAVRDWDTRSVDVVMTDWWPEEAI